MCIVLYKPKGIELPSEDILHNCWDTNRDGAGMVRIGKTSHVKKGYMVWSEFLDAYNAEKFSVKDEFALHFRIGTSGGNIPANCHPFPITSNKKELKILDYTTKYAVLHNGILGPGKDTLSDTMLFTIDVLDLVKNELHKPLIQDGISQMIIGSKLLLIQDGKVIKLGTGWVEDEGIFYTNSSYKEWYYKFYSTSINSRNKKYINYKWDEEYYSGNEYSRSQKRVSSIRNGEHTSFTFDDGVDKRCTYCDFIPLLPEDKVDLNDEYCEEYYCPNCFQITSGSYFWF